MIAAIADTHTIIWYIFGDKRLSFESKEFIESIAHAGDQVGVSSITLAELVYLIERNRIAAETFTRLMDSLESQTVLTDVPFDRDVARIMQRVSSDQVPDLPDRIIAATALYWNVPLITRDHRITSSEIKTIW